MPKGNGERLDCRGCAHCGGDVTSVKPINVAVIAIVVVSLITILIQVV